MLSAAIQLNAGPDAGANLAAGMAAVREAAAAGATLVVLPEKWIAIGDAATLGVAADAFGAYREQLAVLAGELQIDLIAGSVSYRSSDGDQRLFNVSLHVSPNGESGVHTYRKVHLFDADVAGRRYRESEAEQPGDALVVAPLADDHFVAGMAICFDLRFPEMFGALTDRGANVITVPAAFTERTTRDHWDVLVRARAIESGSYVIAPNQCGEHADGSRSGGASIIVSPWGEVLAQAGSDEPEIIYAELDVAAVDHAREALPVRALRRPDLYRTWDRSQS